MSAFPGNNYAPAGVYSKTLYENPLSQVVGTVLLPVFIGEGNEFLSQTDLELVRGSSSSIDQQVAQEDETGRAVVSDIGGVVTLGNFDGTLLKFRVRNYPIVKGDGGGTTTNTRSDVSVTVNGTAVVVKSVDGARGIIELADEPEADDEVRCTYYFNRTDTQTTDTLSGQVDGEAARIDSLSGLDDVDSATGGTDTITFHGDILNGAGAVIVPANNGLVLTVDGVQRSLTLPAGTYTMAQAASLISAFGAETLSATTFINNYGLSALRLNADHSLVVGAGTANSLLGIQSGQADLRTRTFYTYQGPIVDGSNGGVTTTDPADVTVKVNGVQVIPQSVNGATRAVTLAQAPKAGDTVTVTYYHNTWQNTFDYLGHINITDITRCGVAPGVSSYTEDADFVLQDDKIVWGAAALVSTGVLTTGSTAFGENQVTPVLIDNRSFLEACSAVAGSTTQFLLPRQPTLGNGRDTNLSSSIFQSAANDRIGVPVNRPDVIFAYWGYSPQDALERGQKTITKVDGATITLADPVEPGATVYATFWYNQLVDAEYTLSVEIPGPSGTGTYSLQTSTGASVLGASYDTASKGAGLTGVTVEFPSGSELKPDLRFESASGNDFTGPVEEIVTVEFAARAATPAFYTAPGNGPYSFIEDYSDVVGLSLNGQTVGLDLTDPTGFGNGFMAHLVGDPVVYDNGLTWTLASDENFTVYADGVEITGTVAAGAGLDLADFADAINEAANGTVGAAAGGASTDGLSFQLQAATHPMDDIDDIYNNWLLIFGTPLTMGTNGEAIEVADYDAATRTITFATVPTLTGLSTAQVEVLTAGLSVGDTITVNGQPFVGVAGVTVNPAEFQADGGAAVAVTDLAAKITADVAADVTATDGGVAPGGQYLVLTSKTVGIPGVYTVTTNDLTAFDIRDGDGSVVTSLTIDYDSEPYLLINPAALPQMKGSTRFNGPIDLTNGYDQFFITYNGDNAGAGVLAITLTGAVYASVNALVTEINTQLATALGLLGVGFSGLDVDCSADGDGRLVFKLRHAAQDTAGYMAFHNNAGAIANGDNFCRLAGLDYDTAINGDQAVLNAGPIALAYQVTVAGVNEYDRLILRNRILPGNTYLAPATMVADTQLLVGGGNANDRVGVATGEYGSAGVSATVQPASVVGHVGFGGGVDAISGEPQVVFYDGTGAASANDEFTFTFDGVPITVSFTSLPTGQATNLGVTRTPGDGSVLDQVIDALANTPGAPWGNAAAITAAGYVTVEGASLRLTSALNNESSVITVGSGTANSVLGFSNGTTASRTKVTPQVLASALNSERQATLANHLMLFARSAVATEFFQQAFAKVYTDAASREYLRIISAPAAAGTYGTGSIITLTSSTWLRVETGLYALANDGDQGEAALGGFFVISNNANGSGSANTSVLNNGVGQDGMVGQTYRDAVTGLTFTIMPRGYSSNPSGPWVNYPTGATAILRFDVRAEFTTDANIPHNALPGCEITVANTSGMTAGDTAIVETFNPGGNEPSVGDVYYASYVYQKQDFTTSFFTKLSEVEKEYGAATPDNPVSLAAYLAMINGAVSVGIKQVAREVVGGTTQGQASLTAYQAAIEELEGVLPGFLKPDIITPLRGDSTELYQILRWSNDIQSSIRYRSERTSILGVSGGTNLSEVKTLAGQISSDRMRLVYPDTAVLQTEDELGNITEHLVDGTYLAAALVGSVVSPNVDVASPWTNRRLRGFVQLGRTLDAVEQNQVAVAGVTVLEDRPPTLRVRQGFTTDMSNVLTKTPTVRLISDHVQMQARLVLERFIGQKFLPNILSQIEGRLAMLMKRLVAAEIIAAYTGIKANVSASDPTSAEVEAYYQPVFPLLYIILTFHLRSSL